MSDAAIPWLLLGPARRKALAARISAAVETWRREWLVDSAAAVSIDIHEDARARPTDIRAHEASCFRVVVNDESSLVLVVPRRSLAGIVGAPVHGADASMRHPDESSLAFVLEREALTRLAKCIWPAASHSSAHIERLTQSAVDVFRQYEESRFVCASIAIGDKHCSVDVLLASTLVDELLPARPRVTDGEALERRRAAAANQLVELVGVLGVAEVSVSELASLAVGDVVVLQQSLTDAGALAIRGGERVGDAALGRVGEMRAIQIKGRAA